MADELRHWALDDEVTESVLACDTDLATGAAHQRSASTESNAPPPYDATLEADADPSIG